MHQRATQLLLGRHLAGGGLEQGRAGQEGARAALDHDDDVRQARHVGPAGRARAVLHGDDRDARGRQARQVAKQRAAVHEAFDAVAHQVGAGALDQVDEGQALGQRDLLHAQDLVQAHRLDGAGLDARIRGHHHAARAFDEADACNDAAARHGLVGIRHVVQKARQRAQRQPGRAAVQQQRHALARQQLMALGKARAGLGRFGRGAVLQGAQALDARQHRRAALDGLRRCGVPARLKNGHGLAASCDANTLGVTAR